MNKYEYFKPMSVDEALSLFNQYGKKAMLIAGGTDVIVMIKKKEISPDVLISLQRIPGLDQIKYDGALRIGPMATLRTLEKSKVIRERFSALSDAVDVLGAIQIRNAATIGGNICTAVPSADTATPLLVLEAQLKVKSLNGERTIPLDEFFKGPGKTVLNEGEIVTEIIIPNTLPFTGSAYWKHQRRLALDLPILGVSVLLSVDKDTISCSEMLGSSSSISSIFNALAKDELVCKEVRIALGVVAPTPIRAFKAEKVLRGQKLSYELIEEMANIASAEAQPRDSIRGEAWYRRDMIKVFVQRMVLKSVERALKPNNTLSPVQ